MKMKSLLLLFALSTSVLSAFSQYCNSSATSTTYGYIQDVQIGQISSSSPFGCGQQYTDNTAISTLHEPGETVTFTLNVVGCSGGNWTHSTKIFIDYNQNGVFTDVGEEVFALGAHPYGAVVGSFVVPVTASAGSTRIRIITVETSNLGNVNSCGTYTWGETEDYTFTIDDPSVNDAAIVGLTNPNEVICGPVSNVTVQLMNDGKAPLTSCFINWVVRRPGLPAPFPLVSYQWTGNLLPDSIDENVNAGNFQGGFQVGDTLWVVSDFPNNVVDSTTRNDSFRIVFQQGFFGGHFTIGDTTNGAHDYPNLRSAVNFVNSLPGLCDSLVFEIDDSLSFSGQYTIDRLPGASLNRPVIFKSRLNNPTLARITNSANNVDSNFTFHLTNANGIIFQGITFEATNSGQTITTAVRVSENSEQVRFDNCVFTNTNTNTANTNAALLVIDKGSDDVEILDSEFQNGSFGILTTNAGGGNLNNNLIVRGNTFDNQGFGYSRIDFGQNIIFENNLGRSNSTLQSTTAADAIGFNFVECQNGNLVNNNTLIPTGLFPSIGMAFIGCIGSASGITIATNNKVAVGQSFSNNIFHGIAVASTFQLNIANNSVFIQGNNPNSSSLFASSGAGVNVYNNIFMNDGAGVAIRTSSSSAINNSDHNNLFSKANRQLLFNGTVYSSLAAIRASIGTEMNSISTDPLFHSAPSNLHVCSQFLDSAGTPLTYVSDDMDGDTRNAQFPDIGADEFTSLDNFDLGADRFFCFGDDVTLVGGTNTGDINAWSTGSNASSITIDSTTSIQLILRNACGIRIDNVSLFESIPVAVGIDTANICTGQSLMVNAAVAEPATYAWSNQVNDSVITISSPGLYQITVSNAIGCTSTDEIFVTQSGVANIISNVANNTICTGRAAFLDAGLANANYTWIPNVQSPNDQITAITAGGDYWVVVNDKGCITSDTINIREVAPPTAGFNFQTSFLTNQFQSTSTGQGITYSWNFGDNNTSTLPNPVHVYANTGVYTVTLTVRNACGTDVITRTVGAFTVGVDENSKNQFELYPNPAKDLISLRLPSDHNVASIQITSVEGKFVDGMLLNASTQDISVAHLNAGIYFMNLLDSDGNSISTARFIKQ